MYLFWKRQAELADSFVEIRKHLDQLRVSIQKADSKSPADKPALKMELDVILTQIKVIKEEIAYYSKLDQKFDLAKFIDDFIQFLRGTNPEFAEQAAKWVDEHWHEAEN